MRFLAILLAVLGFTATASGQGPREPLAAVRTVLARHPEVGAYLIARGNDVATNVRARRLPGIFFGQRSRRMMEVPEIQPWASVTKQVLAVMIMQQVQESRLALEAPADRYLPELAGGARPPTIRELLQHRSGLFNPDDSAPGAGGMPSYYIATDDPLAPCLVERSAPGGSWRYNNCDYLVLGRILERVSGKPLATLFQERIARPAGLTTARFAGDPITAPHLHDWTEADQRLFTRFGAAGGLVGSMADLQRFDHALVHGQLLSAASRELLWQADPALGYMALGQWVFDAQPQGCAAPLHIVERRGGIGRYQVRNIIVPALDLFVIMFVRDENFDFGEIWQGRGLSHDVLAAAACG